MEQTKTKTKKNHKDSIDQKTKEKPKITLSTETISSNENNNNNIKTESPKNIHTEEVEISSPNYHHTFKNPYHTKNSTNLSNRKK